MGTFEDVKVGDSVVISHHLGTRFIAEVKRVNKTSFVVDCGNYEMSFTKIGGKERGGDTWSSAYAYPATEELVEKVNMENRKEKYIRVCRNCKFEDLPYEVLEQIYNLIK